MSVQNLFVTPVYSARISPLKTWTSLGSRLLFDCYRIEQMDDEGAEWSGQKYQGGYTSYSSFADIHERSTDFIEMRKLIDRHVRSFVKKLEYDVDPKEFKMNTSWINITRNGGHHSMHLHPQSVISGTLYLATPKNSGNLKFEDPRLSKFMAAPARKPEAKISNQTFVEIEPKAGYLVLFESWLRHQVEPNETNKDRVSISFNYSNF
jgi:uncharacterized protein (TIGR02466 family)